MSMQDTIADMFTRIRNGQARAKPFVHCPKTKYKMAILDVLQREGYIEGYEDDARQGLPEIKIQLKYHQGEPVIHKISRVSKPSLPIYSGYDDMLPVCNGLGIRIVSTSSGLHSDRELRKRSKKERQKLGGVVVGEVI